MVWTSVVPDVPEAALIGRLRPYVRQAGDETRPPWRIPMRKLLDYLLVYVESGSGMFEVGGRRYSVRANDLFWIPPDTPHEMEGFPPDMKLRYVHFDLVYRGPVCHWDFAVPGGTMDFPGLEELMHPPCEEPELAGLCGRVEGHTKRHVGNLIREINAVAAQALPWYAVRLSGLMLQVISEILRGREGASGSHAAWIPALEKAGGMMMERCCDGVAVEDVARAVGLSPSHFRKTFRSYYDCSPRDYLQRCRIYRAKQLMGRGDMNVTQIAYACGFATVHSFSRTFSRFVGVSPSQYRRFGTTGWERSQ